MAVIDAVPGLEVLVLVNGQPAKEYDAPAAEEPAERDGERDRAEVPVSRKYIESIDEAEFAIKWSMSLERTRELREEDDMMQIALEIDGDDIGWQSIDSKSVARPQGYTRKFEGMVVQSSEPGRVMFAKFTFLGISRTEDAPREAIAKDKTAASTLGCIKVTVWRGHWTKRSYDKVNRRKVDAPQQEFSHKSLKGKATSHRMKFKGGNPYDPPPLSKVNLRKYVRKSRVASFIFYYQSLEALRQDLIIPRTPSPSPDTAFDRLSEEELQRLARVQFNREQEQIKFEADERKFGKRVFSDFIDLDSDEEGAPIGSKKRKSPRKLASVIDLTSAD